MAIPADLVAHYSERAYRTRIAAITFVGAVLAAEVTYVPTLAERATAETLLGFCVLIVVGSLSELNRRYTHSYLCACRAAAHDDEGWRRFHESNEQPWTWDWATESTTLILKKALNRFLLSWGTYLPGVLGCWVLAGSFGVEAFRPLAWLFGTGMLLWHVWNTLFAQPDSFRAFWRRLDGVVGRRRWRRGSRRGARPPAGPSGGAHGVD